MYDIYQSATCINSTGTHGHYILDQEIIPDIPST